MTYETLVAVYDTAAHADAAVKALKAAGFHESDVSVFDGERLKAGKAALSANVKEAGLWNCLFGSDVYLEGYVRSPARAFDRHEGRPHISRIERSRGPVNRYGESAGAVLVFEALSTLQGLAGGDHGAVRRRRRGFGRSLNA